MSGNSLTDNPDMALNLVDLDRYPIEQLDRAKGGEFLRACQEHMEEHGWCNFDGFVRPDALSALAAEANELLPTAEILTIKRNIYQGKVDPSVPEGDPRRREYVHSAVQLADDLIPAETLIQYPAPYSWAISE